MRINKIRAAGLALFMTLASSLFAQEFDDFGGFDDGGDVGGFSDGATAEKPFSIGGEAKFQPRLYVADVDEDSFGWKSLLIDPSLKLNLSYETDSVEFEGRLAVDKDIVMNYREDILSELTMRVYLGNVVLEAGKEKVVWGKGDKLHVLDLFNANDYTDFIVPDYIDRRLAEPMLRAAWNSPFRSNLRVEAVWTPTMTPDRLGTGRWTPASVGALTDKVTAFGGGIVARKNAEAIGYTSTAATFKKLAEQAQLAGDLENAAKYAGEAKAASEKMQAALASYTLALTKATSLADDLYPDTRKFRYGQAGVRITGTVGMFDLGASYYYGHFKTPSVDYAKMQTYVSKYLDGASVDEDDKFLAYDRLQVFGVEAGGVIGPFNTRAEFGYYLTDDVAGDDPAVRNNSVNWLAGFDIDLPIHNLNVNIQEVGQYILNSADIDRNPYDTEYDKDGIYSNNKIVVNISDSFAHEKVKPEITVLYGVERSDLVIQPKIAYMVRPGFELSAQGMILVNFDSDDKSEFQPWMQNNNSFVQLGVKYSF